VQRNNQLPAIGTEQHIVLPHVVKQQHDARENINILINSIQSHLNQLVNNDKEKNIDSAKIQVFNALLNAITTISVIQLLDSTAMQYRDLIAYAYNLFFVQQLSNKKVSSSNRLDNHNDNRPEKKRSIVLIGYDNDIGGNCNNNDVVDALPTKQISSTEILSNVKIVLSSDIGSHQSNVDMVMLSDVGTNQSNVDIIFLSHIGPDKNNNDGYESYQYQYHPQLQLQHGSSSNIIINNNNISKYIIATTQYGNDL
jgi:hypothetical protein